jgi:hypothetical protein
VGRGETGLGGYCRRLGGEEARRSREAQPVDERRPLRRSRRKWKWKWYYCGSVEVERWLGRRRASDCEVASGGGSHGAHHTQLKVQSVPEHPPPDRALARFAEISPPSPSSQSGPRCRLSGQLGLDVATRCNFNGVYPSHQRFNYCIRD